MAYLKLSLCNGLFYLLKGMDSSKDQSYFLHKLNQQQLSKSIFPLGKILKTDVRKIAKDNNLHNHDRKDSTGICFIGERPFAEFLNQFIPKNPGDIVTVDGKKIGKTPEDFNIQIKNRLEILETKEPPERPSGIKVSSVDELIEKLKNEVGVI